MPDDPIASFGTYRVPNGRMADAGDAQMRMLGDPMASLIEEYVDVAVIEAPAAETGTSPAAASLHAAEGPLDSDEEWMVRVHGMDPEAIKRGRPADWKPKKPQRRKYVRGGTKGGAPAGGAATGSGSAVAQPLVATGAMWWWSVMSMNEKNKLVDKMVDAFHAGAGAVAAIFKDAEDAADLAHSGLREPCQDGLSKCEARIEILEETLKELDIDMYYQIRGPESPDRLVREKQREVVREKQREARRDSYVMTLWHKLEGASAALEEHGSSMRIKQELFNALEKRAAERSAALRKIDDDETGTTFEDGVFRLKFDEAGELVEVFHIKNGSNYKVRNGKVVPPEAPP